MKKIAFFCIPAFGHTNPTLGVVKELVEQGNQVWYYSFRQFQTAIEETGATFIPCDSFGQPEDRKTQDGAKIAKDLAFATKVLVDTTLSLDDAIYEDLLKIQPDCIVADSMALWGKLLARKLQTKFVSSTTTFAFNKESARIMGQSLLDAVKMLFSMPKINRELSRLQAKGYPVNNILEIIANDENTDTIVYTSPEFQPCSESFSDKYAFVGPSVRPVKEPFRKEREKLIYVSMGTVNNDLLPVYQACIDALQDTDYQHYFSAAYTDWVDVIAQMAEELTQTTMGQQLVNHEKLAENVYASAFADGSVVYVNYGSKTVSVKGIRIPAMDFVREEAQK